MSSHPKLLIIFVALIAFLYSSVGFGGATGYLTVMSLLDVDPNIMATGSLLLNIVVAGIALINYRRAGYAGKRLGIQFSLLSIPAAFWGGYLKLSQELYFVLLYVILTYIAFQMLFSAKDKIVKKAEMQPPAIWLSLLCGALIGLLSGMIGIGGGIILSPLIMLMRWGTPKEAAATAAEFIFLNSISGLIGRYAGGNFLFDELCLWLLPFGIAAAILGSYFGARKFSGMWTKRILGVVLLIAVIRFWSGF